MDNKDIAKQLNQLVELLHDSHDGYVECAKAINQSMLKMLFVNLANLRDRMILALESEIRHLGEEPTPTGSSLAAAHRIFIDLKAFLTQGQSETIVNEIRRGEEYTIEHYRNALQQPLPETIKNLLQQQLNEIEANLNTVALEEKVA